MVLKCDVWSTFNSTKLYGAKGDKIKVISKNGNQVLVERELDGNKFYTKADSVAEDPVIVEKPAEQAPVPEPAKPKPVAQAAPPTPPVQPKKKKVTQPNLFE